MSEELDVRTDSELDADDAFTLLGDETRLAILRALGDAAEPGEVTPLSFSELRERADVAGSGRFNYHLGELVGHFVEKVERPDGPAGYRLRFPGVRVYRTLRAGTFTESLRVEPFELDSDCHACDARLEAEYRDLVFRIECPDCESSYYHCHLPPSSIDPDSRAATLRVVDRRVRDYLSSLSNAICQFCSGRMDIRLLDPDEDHRYADDAANEVLVRRECDRCGSFHYTRVGEHLLDHPAVVSFCYERGLDLSAEYVWDLEFVSSDNNTELLGADPWRVAVTVEAGGDRLRVVVDESFDAVDVEEL
ncbi:MULTISPECIES: helix-turn-helix domain-containing protein [Halorussus]|uniref:winged helix-turn-helix domain-containing protein n=1 Tax=Halorussus TaxID=1070314 RepID=UPI000E20CAB2|nr:MULTISPECIES: helix-turn-helix domain-containing protein [Halorussus]NHN60396.1 helix-turn-helix transcriptional regulator [Halorussus sp. JP-T4]